MTPVDAVQAQVDRLLTALYDAAVAERNGTDVGTLSGFIVGARAARDAYLLGGPAGSAFDALAELASAVRAHVDEEMPSD